MLRLGSKACIGLTTPDGEHYSLGISEIQDDKKIVLQDRCWSPDINHLYFSVITVDPDFSDYSTELWSVYRFDTITANTSKHLDTL